MEPNTPRDRKLFKTRRPKGKEHWCRYRPSGSVACRRQASTCALGVRAPCSTSAFGVREPCSRGARRAGAARYLRRSSGTVGPRISKGCRLARCARQNGAAGADSRRGAAASQHVACTPSVAWRAGRAAPAWLAHSKKCSLACGHHAPRALLACGSHAPAAPDRAPVHATVRLHANTLRGSPTWRASMAGALQKMLFGVRAPCSTSASGVREPCSRGARQGASRRTARDGSRGAVRRHTLRVARQPGGRTPKLSVSPCLQQG